MNMIVSPSTFPGHPATLEFENQNTFTDPKDMMFLDNIWFFTNTEKNHPQSCVNRVEVWQDKSGISMVHVSFNMEWCEMMKQAFPENIESKTNRKTRFFHHHEHNWCNLEFQGIKNMKNILDLLKRTQNFSGNSKIELEKILHSAEFVS